MVSSLLISAVVVAAAEAISLEGRNILPKETEDVQYKFQETDSCE